MVDKDITPVTDGKTLTKREEEILKLVREATDDHDRQRKIRNTAKTINDFIQNDQWKDFNPKTKETIDYEIPQVVEEQRHRSTDNLIFPLWITKKSLIQRAMPKVQVKPQNRKDIGDIWGVQFGEIIVDYIYATQWKHMDEKIANLLLSHGTVFPHMTVTQDKKLKTIPIPGNQIFPYPTDATDWKDVLAVAWERMVPLAIMKSDNPDIEFTETEFPEHLMPTEKTRIVSKRKSVHVIDWWIRPHGKKEKGCFVRLANYQIVKFDGYEKWLNRYPYDHKQLPLFPIKENDLSDGIFGFPALELVLNQQVDHNKAISILAEIWDTIPMLLVPEGSKIKPKEAINRRRRVFEYYADAGKPEYTTGPSTNMALVKAIGDKPRQIEHTMCLHEVLLRGESVGSLQSAVALQHLEEQDLAKQYPMSKGLKVGFENMYTQGYALIKQYYDSDEIVEILGDKGRLHKAAYDKIDLSPMTFEVDAESVHPRNRAVDVQNAIQAAQYKAIDYNNPRERMAFLELVAPNLADSIKPGSLDEEMAHYENKMMLEGEKMVPHDFDNHAAHIPIHDELIKDPRFELLKKRGKKEQELWSRIKAHQDVHGKEYEKQQMKMLEMQAQIQAQMGGPQNQGGA